MDDSPPAAGGAFPTHVGVNRSLERTAAPAVGIPHTRGGEPDAMGHVAVAYKHSPHTWG